MRIQLSPSSAADAPAAASPSPLRVALPFRLGGGGGSTVGANARQTEMLRVIAAAVALASPRDALVRVQTGLDKPSDLIQPNIDEAAFREIVDAIDAARANPSSATPADDVVSAARAVGADPRL